MSKYLFFISIFAILGGCAGRVSDHMETVDYFVEGKLAVLQEGRNRSANFRWSQREDDYDVEVWGPLGQGRTRFTGNAQAITVSRGADIVTRGAPEAVMQAHLGYSLPVVVLATWLRGQPAGTPTDVARDHLGRLIRFQEQGWQVKFSKFRQILPNSAEFRPTTIVATRGAQRVNVAIRQFRQ